MDNNLQNKLNALKLMYLKKLETTVVELKKNIHSQNIDINGLYSMVHTISGTSGMYGLNNISDISTNFEVYLKEVKKDPEIVNYEELKNKASDYTAQLERMILVGE